jgi:hypothetical protein
MIRRYLLTVAAGVLVVGMVDAEPAPSSQFLEQVRTHFAAWDRDHNGELSRDEINLSVIDPKVTGPAAAAVAALQRAARSSKYRLPALTPDNLAKCVPLPKDSRGTLPDFDALYTQSLNRIQKANRNLFSTGAPQLEALHQGRLGDCFCLAPLGALIYRDPQTVVRMFVLRPDGGYTVTFGRHALPITALTDAELALTASAGPDGIWVNVYEKAIAEFRRRKSGKTASQSDIDVLAKGGSAGVALEWVTGHAITRFSCKPWREADVTEAKRAELLTDLRGQLTAAFAAKRLVCGGTSTSVKRPPAVLGNHAYAILGYDRAKDVVTLWNPHGNTFTPKGEPGLEHGYATSAGRFQVPLTELVRFFGGFSFETDRVSTE